MSHSTASKEALITQLRGVFVARGYDGATLTNLASAASLSKASLYHHFPGGKPEMAAALVRHAIADLQRQAFSQLSGNQPASERISAFIDGFVNYTDGGHCDCLLAVLNHHSTRADEHAGYQQTIAAQFADWHAALATVFEDGGAQRKQAERAAYDLLAALYGALLIAKMHARPKLFAQAVKRIKKRF